MSTSSENANPAAVEALMRAEETNNLKEYINNQIVELGKAVQQDTFEFRSTMYVRKTLTLGCLLAYDPEVRILAQRAGVDLDQFDDAIAIAAQAIVEKTSKIDPVGQKVFKVVRDLYTNGNYR